MSRLVTMPTKVHSFAAALFCLLALGAAAATADEPPADDAKAAAERAVKMVPNKVAGTFRGGELVELRMRDRLAYIVKPTGKVDPERRWLWEFPFWLGINDGFGNLQHRDYVEKALAAGFHIAGVEIGVSCGSPAAAEVCQEFYNKAHRRISIPQAGPHHGTKPRRADGLRLGISPSRVRRAHRRHLPGH